jgi:alpha-ketoglutarate-dependent taurine dioxygenase
MKITPINRMGSLGVYVDDINMDHMTEEEWKELGKLFVKEMVVVCRNINIDKEQFYDWIPKWGPVSSFHLLHLKQKYGDAVITKDPATWGILDADDRFYFESKINIQERIGPGKHLNRIYGGKTNDGKSLGVFDSGDVFWHSNESALLTFAPAVALLGWEDMGQSATGFTQTIDVYEGVPESMRKELDEMVLIHEFRIGRLSDNEAKDPSLAAITRMNFCPEQGLETPFVCTAPNGRKGLHYSINSRARIKGMSEEESNNLFDRLDKLIFNENMVFDHEYIDTRRDMLFFDNSVTLHRRVGHQPTRLGFRTQFTLCDVVDQPWLPWQHMPEYDREYRKDMKRLVEAFGGDLAARYPLPELI